MKSYSAKKQKIIIDVGSSNLTIYGGGFLLRKPNVAVIRRANRTVELVAVGNEVSKLKTIPEHCSIIYPVKEGNVVSPDVFAKMLSYYLEGIVKISLMNPIELYVMIPSGLTRAERDNVEASVVKAGYKDVTLIESVLGLIPVLGTDARLVCLLGGGTTEVAVINGEGIISGCTVNVSGNAVNEKIIDQLLKNYNLGISSSMAERLKIEIGSLFENDTSEMTVTGEDLLDRRIKNVAVTSESLRAPILWCYKKIAELIESVLTTIPVGMLAKISADGLYLAGGGAEMRGLADFLTRYLKLPVTVSTEAETEVIKGAYRLVTDDTGRYNSILANKR